jgi:FlaA1/EpsC-like NDP-sugar epimerase
LTEFGQSVLVTGAGGYIGSALVKAIAAAGPSRLVLLDSCEQNLFEISRVVPGEAILGSVTDAALVDDLFRRFQPSIGLPCGGVQARAAAGAESLRGHPQ